MVRKLLIATTNDLQPSAAALKEVIPLINLLPDDNAKIWATPTELHSMLIHGGADKSLTLDNVTYVLRHENRSGILATNRFKTVNYYRPSRFTGGCPSKRTLSQLRLLMPRKNHFKNDEVARHLLNRLNGEFERIRRLKQLIEDGKVKLMVEKNVQYSSGAVKEGDRTIPIQIDWDWKELQSMRKKDAASQCMRIQIEEGTHTVSVPTDHKWLEAWCDSNENAIRNIQKDANANMIDPPSNPNSFVDKILGEIDYSDGYGIFKISKLIDFMCSSAEHSFLCQSAMELKDIDFKHRACIVMNFGCPQCGKMMDLKNCDWITTPVVEEGRHHSRAQPELNVRIVKGAREVGANLEKVKEFISFLGVRMCTYQNMLHLEKKFRSAVEGLSKERISLNMREHATAARSQIDYAGDIEWEETVDGVRHVRRTCQGPGSFDGAGLTRAYNHRIKGTQSALVVFSLLTRKPIAVVHKQIKCILCTRAYNKRNNNRKQNKFLDGTTSTKHAGRCFRNSSHGPSVAEEYAATEAARMLLFDDDGYYQGDDCSIFLNEVTTDNDTKGPTNFIKEQNRIMGAATDCLACQLPDSGHVIKCCSNAIYKIRSNDSTFQGTNLLENLRIKCIVSDIRSALNSYKEKGIGIEANKTQCLNSIYAVVYHHCGDHSHCTDTDICNFARIQLNNPTWSEEKVQMEYAEQSVRFGGRYMALHSHGIDKIQREIKKRFCEDNINRLAKLSCSNSCELFFSALAKYTEGKRLCLEHTDLWRSIILFVFCRTGNIEDTHNELSKALGCKLTTAETKHLATRGRKRRLDGIRASSDQGKQSRRDATATTIQRTGKEDVKKRHKSGKLNLNEAGKSKVQRPCTKCGQCGHGAQFCPTIAKPERKRQIVSKVDWNSLAKSTVPSIESKKKSIDWSKISLVKID